MDAGIDSLQWVNYQTRQLISSAAGGLLSNKYPDKDEQSFEDMARNESHWAPKAIATQVAGIHEEDTSTDVEAKVEALTRKFDLLMTEKASSSSKAVMLCGTCGNGLDASQ